MLKYDPFVDDGCRLWHPKHNCYLASTFRTFPDYNGVRGNDTITNTINLELEASCTVGANELSSRIYLIEGKITALDLLIFRRNNSLMEFHIFRYAATSTTYHRRQRTPGKPAPRLCTSVMSTQFLDNPSSISIE